MALAGTSAKRFEVAGLMGLGLDELFSTPAYWLEAAVLVAFFVLVNMFPCIRTCGDHQQNTQRGYLPTPIQALTDSLGRETTSKECCQPRECFTCLEREVDCQCPPWAKRLAPICEDEDTDDEEGCRVPFECDTGPEEDPCCDPCDPCNPCCPPKPKRRKKRCNPRQTTVTSHCREVPSGGFTSVKSHCRYLPGCKPTKRRNRSRSTSCCPPEPDPCCDPCSQAQ